MTQTSPTWTPVERKRIWSWGLYDFANSSFSTTIMAGFFPLFFKQYWSQGIDSTVSTARLGAVISGASLLIAILSPYLGAWSDLRGNKKLLTFLFMLFGVLGSAGLAFVPEGGWTTAALLYGLALVGFTASCTFYDSLLPSLVHGKATHSASSFGFAMGYLGGGLLFLLNVLVFLNPAWFGLSSGVQAVQVAFVSVAIWWMVFSVPLFVFVPEPPLSGPRPSIIKTFQLAQKMTVKTFLEIMKQRNLALFLAAYWLYIDGVFAIMGMAVDFDVSIGLEAKHLIAALLLVQFVGVPFAFLFSRLAVRWGCKIPILICLGIYCVALFGGTKMTTSAEFYVLAALIGMSQGGVQALSRSLFSQMTPVEKSGEYFGFFNLIGKFASILGPILIGWGTYFFQDHRKGILTLLVLIIFGGILLLKVKEPSDAS